MKEAMRAHDALRLSVIRAVLAAFTNECVSKGKGPAGELTDEEALAVIRRERNKRKDAAEQFSKGARPELAESEEAELKILEEFLPTQMSAEQIKPVVEAKIKELGLVAGPTLRQAQGKLMQAVMHELKGKADGGAVKDIVEKSLV